MSVLLPATRLARKRDHVIDQLEHAARRVRRGEDVEAIHDLRVAARRIEAGLDLWRDVVPASTWRRARRGLRSWRRPLGPARESQIGDTLLRERAATMELAPALEPVLAALEKRRDRLVKSAARRSSRARLRRVRRRIERLWSRLEEQKPGFSDRVAAARPRIAQRLEIMTARLARARTAWSDDALHLARIAVKRARYALEWAEALGEPRDRRVAAMRKIQEDLGRINDLAVLRSRLTRIARRTGVKAALIEPLGRMTAALEFERADRVRHLHGLLESPAWRAPVLHLADRDTRARATLRSS
jgi:CHAD domain-containing protein